MFTPDLIIIALLIITQVWVGAQTFRQIGVLADALPPLASLSLGRSRVADVILERMAPRELLNNLPRVVMPGPLSEAERIDRVTDLVADGYTMADAIDRVATDETREPTTNVITLNQTGDVSDTMARIREAINVYLLRNRGAVVDFNLLRDIVERNLDALEAEIGLMLPVPLYLGLLGTMFGIVYGLFNMPTLEIKNFMDGGGANNLLGVNGLLNGVRNAMIASAVGLTVTVIGSWRLRAAKVMADSRKHDLFTFLQTELLPVISQSLNTGIYDLNRSLDRFGQQFADTASQLDRTIGRNYDAMQTQQQMLETLQTLDLNRIVTYNVQVMNQLLSSTASLERFGTFLSQLDGLTDNARQLVNRTNDVAGLADKIDRMLTDSQALQQFLNSHFQQLEQRGQLINSAVVRMDDVVDAAFSGLKQMLYERIEAVRTIGMREEDMLTRSFAENRTALGQLRHLETLNQTVGTLARQEQTQQQTLTDRLNQLETSLQTINETLDRMRREQNRPVLQRWFGRR
jgi:hypothetical protein